MTDSERYRGMARNALDVAYNNRAVVPHWETYIPRWHQQAKMTYDAATLRDLRYGVGNRQRIDLFLSIDKTAPTCLFLHGGYWQWNDKEGQACVADGIRAIGLGAAIGEYTLAPEASMDEICAEVLCQVDFLSSTLQQHGHSGSVVVCGISAGAHLMACALGMECVVGGLLISGIYDLEPIRISSLNDPIQMNWEVARRWSPLHQIPESMPPLVIAFGADERPELCRQSIDYHSALSACGHAPHLLPVAGTNHFSVLDTLIDGNGVLACALKALATNPHHRTNTQYT